MLLRQTPDRGLPPLPRRLPVPELSEGPHLSYAIQWFAFALILGIGYPLFVAKQEREDHDPAQSSPATVKTDQLRDLPAWKGGHDNV